MNFLSHYAINKEVSNPHYTLGKVFPDLVRGAEPSTHVRSVQAQPGWDAEVVQLARGINAHLQTDKLFHESEFFTSRMASLKNNLSKLNFEGIQRFYFFYAHIGVELLLDRWLMQDNPLLVDNFYSQLSKVDEVTISRFLRYKDLAEITDTVLVFITRFTEAGYLRSYLDLEGIVYALSRISQRAGLPVFSKSDARLFVHTLQGWERENRHDYLAIFGYIEKQING